jgi:hypothetical protein
MAAARPPAGAGWQFAIFRAWREREHPRSSYLIGPHVWTAEGRVQADEAGDPARRALKNWEPRITGVAYSDRAIYLVEVVAKLTAEHVGKILYLADLFRADADWAEHRSKRVHLVMLAREAAPSVLEFARRRRIHVAILDSDGDEDLRRKADPRDQESAMTTKIAND